MSNNVFIQSVQQSMQANSLNLNLYQIEQLKKSEQSPLVPRHGELQPSSSSITTAQHQQQRRRRRRRFYSSINNNTSNSCNQQTTISANAGQKRHYQSIACEFDNDDSLDIDDDDDGHLNGGVGKQKEGVGWGFATFLLVNAALGAGMLHYPYAYNQVGGVWPATLLQIALLFLIAATMFILIYCADLYNVNNYHGVLLVMCGKRAQRISAISILLTCFGINVTFLVIIGDQYDRIFNSLVLNAADYWYLDRKFTIAATAVVFVWPMCYAQRLDFLRHVSILGLFSMIYVCLLTIYEYIVLDTKTIAKIVSMNHTQLVGTLQETQPVQWFNPLLVVPILCFAYQTHEIIVPVYACMKKRNMCEFMKTTVISLVLLFFVYNIVGSFGYLTFGINVEPDIMSSYDGKDPFVVIGIVFLVIKFITTYPQLLFCGRGAFEGLYGEFKKMDIDEYEATEKSRRIVITTCWFLTTVALAVFAPDISLTLQLLGSMASINVFVFPGMCLVSLTMQQTNLSFLLKLGLRIFAALLIIAGLFIFILEILFVFYH